MKRYTTFLTVAAMIFLLAFSAMPVLAEETGWENYDWENFSIQTVTDEDWASMCDYFEAGADLSLVFSIAMQTDGAFSEDISIVLGNRFEKDPYGLIQALALEKADTQKQVIDFIVYNQDYHREEFEKLLSEVTLPDAATEAEITILVDMIAHAEENYGMSITNPKTGDFTEVAAALFVLCSGGLITTISWKKDF